MKPGTLVIYCFSTTCPSICRAGGGRKGRLDLSNALRYSRRLRHQAFVVLNFIQERLAVPHASKQMQVRSFWAKPPFHQSDTARCASTRGAQQKCPDSQGRTHCQNMTRMQAEGCMCRTHLQIGGGALHCGPLDRHNFLVGVRVRWHSLRQRHLPV